MEIDVNIKKVNGDVERVRYTPQMKYDKNNTVQIKMKLNKNTDADIIERLASSGNQQGYIKELIRKDIKKDAQD